MADLAALLWWGAVAWAVLGSLAALWALLRGRW